MITLELQPSQEQLATMAGWKKTLSTGIAAMLKLRKKRDEMSTAVEKASAPGDESDPAAIIQAASIQIALRQLEGALQQAERNLLHQAREILDQTKEANDWLRNQFLPPLQVQLLAKTQAAIEPFCAKSELSKHLLFKLPVFGLLVAYFIRVEGRWSESNDETAITFSNVVFEIIAAFTSGAPVWSYDPAK